MSKFFSRFWSTPDVTPPESRGVGKLSPRSTLSTPLRTQPNTPTTPAIPIPSPTINLHQDPFIVGDYLVYPGKSLGDIDFGDCFAETYQAIATKRVGKDNETKSCTLKRIPSATAVLKKACEDEIQLLSELAKGGHPTTFPLLDSTISEQPNEDGPRWDILYLFSDLGIKNISRMVARHERDGTMIAEDNVIRIAIDLVDALTFLHGCKPPLLHRNIRPSSVIQTSSGTFKFFNFMSAGFPNVPDLLVDGPVAEDLECYTDPIYRSPEMIGDETQLGRDPGKCTAESDIWCIGILLYFMCHQRHPFKQDSGGNILKARLPKHDRTLYPKIEPLFGRIFVRDPKARLTANLLRAALCDALECQLPSDNVPSLIFSETTRSLFRIPRQSYRRTSPELVGQGSSFLSPPGLNQSIVGRNASTSSRNRASSNKQRKDGSYSYNVPLLSPPPPSSHHRSKSEPPVKRSDDKEGAGNVPTIFIEGAGGEPPSGSLSPLTAVSPGPPHPYPSLSVPPSPTRSNKHTRSRSDGAHPPPDRAFATLLDAQNSKKNDSAYLSADRPPSTEIKRSVELPLPSASLDCTHNPDTRIDSDDIQNQSDQSNGALRLETGLVDEGKALPPIPPDESPDIPEQATQAETSSPTDDIGRYVTIKSSDPIFTNGHFGDILEGVHKTVGKVALKRPRFGSIHNDNDIIRRFEREGVNWRGFDHPHILKFLGTFKRGKHIYFVSPFIDNGTLLEYVQRHPGINRVRLLCETADAIAYLHEKKVVHGDIKASNILIDKDAGALLCDFGLTKSSQTTTSTAMKGAGTARWQSPELWENAPKTFESDVYAFAMTIAEVITGAPPFSDLNDVTFMKNVIVNKVRPEKVPIESHGISYENAWEVAEACWKEEPGDRIRISEAFRRLQEDLSLVQVESTVVA